MSRLIRQAGADVVTARDGEEGLGYLLTQRFDVLLTDLRMPVMDGFELVHHCMKLPESASPPARDRDQRGIRGRRFPGAAGAVHAQAVRSPHAAGHDRREAELRGGSHFVTCYLLLGYLSIVENRQCQILFENSESNK